MAARRAFLDRPPMTASERERAEELAHGGLASQDGDLVELGDGVRWWLNGQPWARNEADGLIFQDRARVAAMRQQIRGGSLPRRHI